MLFFGKVYNNQNYDILIGDVLTFYTVINIKSNGELTLHTKITYTFNKNGPNGEGVLLLEGYVFTSDMKIINGELSKYKTKNSDCLVIGSSKNYVSASGSGEYIITGFGVGTMKLDVTIIN